MKRRTVAVVVLAIGMGTAGWWAVHVSGQGTDPAVPVVAVRAEVAAKGFARPAGRPGDLVTCCGAVVNTALSAAARHAAHS